jgi:hypothetical protein
VTVAEKGKVVEASADAVTPAAEAAGKPKKVGAKKAAAKKPAAKKTAAAK